MIRALACLLLLAAAWPAAAHPPTQLNVDGEKGVALEITEFRRLFAEAVAKKDAAALRAMYAETYQHTHTSGKIDGRDTRIVSLLAGDPVIETAPADDLVIRTHAGGWVAIAFGTSPIKSSVDGKTYAVRWTIVYVRTENSWQIAASQATRSHELKN